MNGNNVDPNKDELKEKISLKVEKQSFRRHINVISIVLLLHAALYVIYGLVINFIMYAAEINGVDTAAGWFEIFTDICGALMYIFMFLFPAKLILKFAPPEKKHISLKISVPKHPVVLTVGTVGIITVFGLLTNVLILLLRSVGIGVLTVSPEVPEDAAGIVLLVITSVIIPAFVEEILFRKVILNTLLPYGEKLAVFLSALAFALMHCNPSQLLFAFVAGLILGCVTVKTKSVFFPMIIHGANNSLSVIYILLYGYTDSAVYTAAVTSVDTLLLVLGLVFTVYLKKTSFFLPLTEKNDTSEATDNSIYRPKFKDVICPYSLAYVVYVIYLMSRWVYTI